MIWIIALKHNVTCQMIMVILMFLAVPSFHNGKNPQILVFWKDNDWHRIKFPTGRRDLLITFSNNKYPLHLYCYFLTYHLAFLVTLCWCILFLSLFIFGEEKGTGLEAAAGIWKYALPCLFCRIAGICCQSPYLGDFKSLSVMWLLKYPSHQASSSPVTWKLVLIIKWCCDGRCGKHRNHIAALKEARIM